MLLLIKKHTDTWIDEIKTKPQETFEFKMNKQAQTSSFNPLKILVEEGKRLLAVTSFEANNSVFNTTDENNSFSINIPGCWRIPNFLPEGIIDKLKELLKLRSENDIDLHVAEIRKNEASRYQRETKKYTLSDLDTQKMIYFRNLKAYIITILKI